MVWVTGMWLRCGRTGLPGEGEHELESSCLETWWLHWGELDVHPESSGEQFTWLCHVHRLEGAGEGGGRPLSSPVRVNSDSVQSGSCGYRRKWMQLHAVQLDDRFNVKSHRRKKVFWATPGFLAR